MKICSIGYFNDYEKIELNRLTEELNVSYIKIPKLISKFLALLNKINNNFASFLLCKFYKLYGIEKYDFIIMQDNYRFKKILSEYHEKTIVIFRNIVNPKTIFLTKSNYCFTFDCDDAIKFKMIKYEQFVPSISYIKEQKIEKLFNISFIGRDKGRRIVINRILSKLINVNLLIKYIDSKISYKDYLHMQYNAECVLEIVMDKQVGPSMRLIESQILGRKIITNNKAIKLHKLYHPNNILIVNNTLKSAQYNYFMLLPFHVFPDNDVAQYDSMYVHNKIIQYVIEDTSIK
jgi:hypothetical protein